MTITARSSLVVVLATGTTDGEPGPRPVGDLGERLWQAAGWVLLILVVLVTALLLAMWVKRQILGRPGSRAREGAGFTLSDLRELRREGKISQEEYERTRDRIVQAAQVAIADAAGDMDRPAAGAPLTKDVDLVREAEQ